MKKSAFLICLLLAGALMAQESYVQLPADSTGKKLRHYQQTVGANTVYTQFFIPSNTAGSEIGLVASPIFVRFSDGASAYVGAKDSQLPSSLGQKTTANSLSVTLSSDHGNVPISGTVTANLGTLNGAATAAKQPALGTAGTASADVITVQGIAGMTAVKVDGSAVTQPVSGTVTANAGSGTFTVSGTVTANAGTGTLAVDQTDTAAPDYDIGAGTVAQAVVGIALPGSGGPVAGGTSTNPVRTDPTGTTTQPVSGTITANAGSGTFMVDTEAASATSAPAGTEAGLIVRNIPSGTQTVSGTVTANAGTGNFSIVGTLTNNNAAPGTNNLGVLSTRANASDPTWTEGNQTLLSSTLAGYLRVTCNNCGGSTFADNAAFTFGTTAISNIGFVLDDVAPNAATENSAAAARISSNRMQLFQLGDGAGNERRANVDASNRLTVFSTLDQTGTGNDVDAIQSGTWTVQPGNTANTTAWLFKLSQATTDNDVDVLTLPSVTIGTFPDNEPFNLAQWGGTTVLAGNGVTGTGSPRVTVASDNTPFAVKTDQTTHGTTDLVAADMTKIGGSNVSTAATGVQKVGIVGNGGATIDSTAAAGTAPTNAVLTGAKYNATAPAPTDGQAMAVQADQAGNLRMARGIATATLSGWTSGTALNSTQTFFSNSGAGAVLVHLVQGSTITGGAITFEVSYDNSNWVTIPADAVLDPSSATDAQIAVPYTLQQSTNKPFLLVGKGWQGLRIKLSTVITGTGTVTPNYALLSYEPASTVIALSPTAANFNVTTTPPSNASTNVAQFGGSAVVTGTGAGGSGIPRVTLSNDSSLAANQSVNAAQINGVTPLMGNGVTGTGSPRVTISSDNSAVSGMGVGATGSAVPANANYVGGNAGGNTTGYLNCDSTAIYDAATNGKTTLVALVSGKKVYVCGFSITQSTSTAVTVSLGSGTGTNCATTYAAKTPAWPIQAPASAGPAGLVHPPGMFAWFSTVASENLCISTNAAVSVQAIVQYTQF